MVEDHDNGDDNDDDNGDDNDDDNDDGDYTIARGQWEEFTWSRRVKDTVCRNGHFKIVSCSPGITCSW